MPPQSEIQGQRQRESERSRAALPAGVELMLLYDGGCPLCMREIEMLRRRDKQHAVAFADIAAPDFDASRFGLSHEAVMARIHAVLPDGRVIEGVEVFRRAYRAVGLGWLLAPTGWPLIGRLFDALYTWFARNRLRLTGRSHACDDACTPRLPAAPSADLPAAPAASLPADPAAPTNPDSK